MLFGPAACAFAGHYWNQTSLGFRPGDATTLTASASANTYGSYVEVLSDTTVALDCYAVNIYLFNSFVSSANRSCVVTIGKDETGGTSYTDWIEHLIIPPLEAANGIPLACAMYHFPLFVKAGTAIAAKVAGIVGSSTVDIVIELLHTPLNPETLWYGSYVETFGASVSGGTSITLGEASEGSWTQVGSNPTRPLHYWQFGYQVTDTTMTSALLSFDFAVGGASNKFIVWEDIRVVTANTEAATVQQMALPPPFYSVTSGDLLYLRGQHSSTPDTGNLVALYGVG